LYDIVNTGAKLFFREPIEKIKVIEYGPEQEMPGSTKENKVVAGKEGPEKEIEFRITNGNVDIKSLVNDLSKVDWRWQLFQGRAFWFTRVYGTPPGTCHGGHFGKGAGDKGQSRWFEGSSQM
jgi:hypothetical protein